MLAAGVTGAIGSFRPDDAVEIAGTDGVVFARGLVRVHAEQAYGMDGAAAARSSFIGMTWSLQPDSMTSPALEQLAGRFWPIRPGGGESVELRP